MINILFNKILNKKSESNNINEENIYSLKLVPKVFAISVESNDNKNNDNKDNNENNSDINDLLSKESISSLKKMSVWESLKHQYNRKIDTKDEKYKIQFVKEGETGLDRIKLMWTEWSAGEDNPEVRFIMSSLGYGAMSGGVIGGILGNKTAVSDFIRRHNEYVYRGDFEAKRKIRDTMLLKFMTSGFRLSWRVALFSGLITGLTTTAIAYRNEVYYSDCMAAGALVCSLWKIKLGLRAMAVSGLVGSILGLVFAGSLKLGMWTLNTSVPEYRYWRHTRYLGHLTVQHYSDGQTEYHWNLPESDKTPSK